MRYILISLLLFVLNDVCEERGHVIRFGVVTLLAPHTEIFDTEDSTLLITHDPNTISGYCERCGECISETFEPDTVVIWRKKDE